MQMSNYRVYSDELSHASRRKSRSRYRGGFIQKNGRTNNSSAYNHDYYMQNKGKLTAKNQTMGKKKGFSFKDSVNNFLNGWRDKAIDTISDFMVDLSVAYIDKMLNSDKLKDMKVDDIIYDKLSPVVNKLADEAVDRAMQRATKNATDAVTKAAEEAVNKTLPSNAAQSVNDWLNKIKR